MRPLDSRRAREIDPLDFTHQALSAQVAFNTCDRPAAVEFARRANIINPEFWIGYFQLAQVYEQMGETVLAFEALQKAAPLSGGNSKVISMRGYLFAKLGKVGEAQKVINTLESVSRDRFVDPKWNGLRADARFTALLDRCAFATGGTSPPPA